MNKIYNFKNDVDDIVGYEIDELIFYIAHMHSLAKTKYQYTLQEIYDNVLPIWAEIGTTKRDEGRDNYYWVEDEFLGDIEDNYVERYEAEEFLGHDEAVEEERGKIRAKSQEIFHMKVEKHFNKIAEVFE